MRRLRHVHLTRLGARFGFQRPSLILALLGVAGFVAGCAMAPSPIVSRDGLDRIAAIGLLTNSGQMPEAFAEIQACWREIPNGGNGYGTAHSLLLRQLTRLAVVYPPAHEHLDEWLRGEGNPGFDPLCHGQLAEAYEGAGRAADALREYLWCVVHTQLGDLSYLRAIAGIGRLGRTHQSARDAFVSLYGMLDQDSRQTGIVRRTAAQLGLK